jgi:hypothetical protein
MMPINKNNPYTLLCQTKGCFCSVTRIVTIPVFNQFFNGNLKNSKLKWPIEPFETLESFII